MIEILSLTPRRVLEPIYRQQRGELGGHHIRYYAEAAGDARVELLRRADFIIGDWTHENRLDAASLEQCERLQLIAQPSAGFDVIDVDAAAALSIPVANAPGANADSVAEWTVMSALMCLKNAVKNHERLQNGEWWMDRALDEGVYELSQRRVGILGFGAIGRGVAARLAAFGIKQISYYDPFISMTQLDSGFPVTRYERVDEVCRESDVLCVHSPLTPETRNMIDGEELELLGSEGVLVNASRGGVVNEDALSDALINGVIKAAALDVFTQEPLPQDHKWKDVPNVFVSPHISGGTVEARDRMISSALSSIKAALSGVVPSSVVNGVSLLRA